MKAILFVVALLFAACSKNSSDCHTWQILEECKVINTGGYCSGSRTYEASECKAISAGTKVVILNDGYILKTKTYVKIIK